MTAPHIALTTSYQDMGAIGPHRKYWIETTDKTCAVGIVNGATTSDMTDGVYVVDRNGSPVVLSCDRPASHTRQVIDGSGSVKYILLSGTVTGGVYCDGEAISAIVQAATTAYTPAVGGNYTGSPTSIAAAADELASRTKALEVSAKSTQASIVLNVYSFREVSATGDVGDITANGGVLASDTTPIMRGDSNNSAEINWATGNVDPIGTSFMLPTDIDDTGDVTLDLVVSSGTTNAATMGVATSWNGGSEVTDSADDSATKSATRHVITATIATADVPSGANHVTIRLTPPTHSTNTISLYGARLNYLRKLLAS